MRQTRHSRFIGVDLFSGAGGLSCGARLAGIDVALAVETDSAAAATYRLNHPESRLLNGDVRSLRASSLPKARSGQRRILFGGPPCQGFSYSNQQTRTAANPSNWLFKEFVRIARAWRPDWVVLENVKGITDTEGGLFLEEILSSFKKLGYTTQFAVLDAADFGVAQHRRRVFVVGSLNGERFRFPIARRDALVTVSDALSDLPLLPNGNSVDQLPYRSVATSLYAKRLRDKSRFALNNLVTRNASFVLKRYSHVPQGSNWESIPARLMKNYRDRSRSHTGLYHRLRSDLPSIVIGNFRKNMLIHPNQDRGLSVREAARIQSFPDSYKFVGSIGFQQQQVGNAVPPILAEAVFSAIVEAPLAQERS